MTGVFTGRYAAHPLTGEPLPIWIADYVLAEYGEGAVMGVPAHDARDFAFAEAMGLPIRTVVVPTDTAHDAADELEAPGSRNGVFTDRGTLIHSADFTGMSSTAAAQAIVARLEERGAGKPDVRYHLRDWLVSRQRYWGTPIPIIYCRMPDDSRRPRRAGRSTSRRPA